MSRPLPGPPARRAPTRVSPASLVRTSPLGEGAFGLVIEPTLPALDPVGWAAGARGWVDERLLAAGALLFRGFELGDAAGFRGFLGGLGADLLDYPERAARRREVAPGVFTSTEFPPDQSIPLHHEMSYAHRSPALLWFYCERAAPQGGATPLACERTVTRAIPPATRERLLAGGVRYVRNYGEGVDMSWQEAFQVDQRGAVEEYCRRNQMSFEWRDGDRLRTSAVRPAMVEHPRTGEALWFNHAPIFHESNLPASVRAGLREQFRPDEMPRNAFFADGSPIEDELMAELRAVYDAAAVRFEWRAGDVLMVDNFLAAHGRDPFAGPRSILVSMAGSWLGAGAERDAEERPRQ